MTSFVGSSDDDATPNVPVTSYQYRNVGTNVTCRARSHEDGFRITLEFEQSSILANEGAPNPSFRTFNVSNELWLQLDQSQDLAVVSSPNSEDVWKIEITLHSLE